MCVRECPRKKKGHRPILVLIRNKPEMNNSGRGWFFGGGFHGKATEKNKATENKHGVKGDMSRPRMEEMWGGDAGEEAEQS